MMKKNQPEKSSLIIVGLIILVAFLGLYYIVPQQETSTGKIYHSTDLASPSPQVKTICMSNQDCGSGMFCQQVCNDSSNGKCSPGKCLPGLPDPPQTKVDLPIDRAPI